MSEDRARYPRTDDDVLGLRLCPDCGYDIRPGYEHGRMPQPEGASHVVCSLQRVEALSRFGPCQVCGVDCRDYWVEGLGIVKAEHHGPVADDHEAKPGSLPQGLVPSFAPDVDVYEFGHGLISQTHAMYTLYRLSDLTRATKPQDDQR